MRGSRRWQHRRELRTSATRLHEKAAQFMCDRILTGLKRPISVYSFPRRALTLCPQLCMGFQPGARFPAWSADALTATLYGHFAQAIY